MEPLVLDGVRPPSRTPTAGPLAVMDMTVEPCTVRTV